MRELKEVIFMFILLLYYAKFSQYLFKYLLILKLESINHNSEHVCKLKKKTILDNSEIMDHYLYNY